MFRPHKMIDTGTFLCYFSVKWQRWTEIMQDMTMARSFLINVVRTRTISVTLHLLIAPVHIAVFMFNCFLICYSLSLLRCLQSLDMRVFRREMYAPKYFVSLSGFLVQSTLLYFMIVFLLFTIGDSLLKDWTNGVSYVCVFFIDPYGKKGWFAY